MMESQNRDRTKILSKKKKNHFEKKKGRREEDNFDFD